MTPTTDTNPTLCLISMDPPRASGGPCAIKELVASMDTPPRSDLPWAPFVRFRVLSATTMLGTRVVVEAYSETGSRVHRFTVPFRYDVSYSDHCEAIARLILGDVTVRFEADDWAYYA